MNTIKHLRQGSWLLAIAVAASFLYASAHAEEEWIALKTSDSLSPMASSFNSDANWSSGKAPEAGKNYRTDRFRLNTPNDPAGDYVFTGACLKIERQLWHLTPSAGSATISNMVGVGGAEIYTSGGKGPLCGTLTLQSTLDNPFWWKEGNASAANQKLWMNLVGGEGSRLSFTNQAETAAKTFYYDGDLSGFYGMFDTATSNTLIQLSGSATNFPGTLKSANGGQLKVIVAAGATNSVGTIDTTDLTVELNAGSVLHVESGFETHGVPVKLIYNPALVTNAEEHVLMTFGAGVEEPISESDFDIDWSDVSNLTDAGLSKHLVAVVKRAQIRTSNGVRSLVVSHGDIVYLSSNDVQSTSSAFGDGKNWDRVPADPSSADYYILEKSAWGPLTEGVYTIFPGASLTVGGAVAGARGHLSASKTWQLNVSDFRWAALDKDGDRKYLSIYGHWTVGGGTITVLPAENAAFGIEGWNNRLVTFDSSFRGAGHLLLTLNEAAKEPRANFKFTADNTAFTGRIRASHKPFTYSAFTSLPPTANASNYFVTITVTNQNNLGGALPAFDAEALTLADNSLLSVTQSAVFDEPTRGWTIKGHGRITVPEAATVVVTNKTITYVDGGDVVVGEAVVGAGRFTKEGAGTLVLGGTAVAESGETKVLEVKEGALRFASTAAASDLTVSVKSGATLSLDLSETGEFREKGVVNASATPFTVEGGGAIPVELMSSAELSEKAVEVAICTVPDTLGGSLAFSVPSRFSKRFASVVTHDNGDGTVTFAVRLESANTGFMVIFR